MGISVTKCNIQLGRSPLTLVNYLLIGSLYKQKKKKLFFLLKSESNAKSKKKKIKKNHISKPKQKKMKKETRDPFLRVVFSLNFFSLLFLFCLSFVLKYLRKGTADIISKQVIST